MRTAVVFLFIALGHTLSLADDAVPPAAEIERSAAVTASTAGAWDKALAAGDKAIKLAPKWAEAYRTRAGIRIAAAGPEGTVEQLKTPVAGIDYKRVAKLLQGASEDLKRYADLSPQASDVKAALRLAGEVRVRGELAATASKTKWLPASCYDGQTLQDHRCRGFARCPRGMGFDAASETCTCMPGAVKASNDTHYCCWPNQIMAVKDGAYQCTGTPVCPAGYARIDAFATCVPMMFLENLGTCGGDQTGARPWVPDEIAVALGMPVRNSAGYVFDGHWKAFFDRYLLPPGLNFSEKTPTGDRHTKDWETVLQPSFSAKSCRFINGDYNVCCKSL